MSPKLPELPELEEIVNHAPNCVAMKLHVSPVQKEQKKKIPLLPPKKLVAKHDQINLALTINFSAQQEVRIPDAGRLFPGGSIVYGVSRAKLQLTLEKCKMPLEKTGLNPSSSETIEVEVQEEQSNEIQVGGSVEAGISSPPKGTISGNVKIGGKKTEKYKNELPQIYKAGDEDAPMWVFETQKGRPFLELNLTERHLGIIQIDTNPCSVEAVLTIRPEDIRLNFGNLGWTKNIVKNKLAAIERAIVLNYIDSQLNSPLSKAVWRYD